VSNGEGRYSVKNRKENIKRLSMIFAEYQIYPLSCYKEKSPVRVFQRHFFKWDTMRGLTFYNWTGAHSKKLS